MEQWWAVMQLILMTLVIKPRVTKGVPSLRWFTLSQQLELLAFPLERRPPPDTGEKQHVQSAPSGLGSGHALQSSCLGHICGFWISSKLPPGAPPPPFSPRSPPPGGFRKRRQIMCNGRGAFDDSIPLITPRKKKFLLQGTITSNPDS